MAKFFLILLAALSPIASYSQEKQPTEEVIPYPYQAELDKAEAEGDSRFMSEFLYMLFLLGMMISLIFIATWYLKRLTGTKLVQKAADSGAIQVLEQKQITPRTSVYLIEIEGRKIAIAEGNQGVTYLGEGPHFTIPKSFEQILKGP